MANKYLRPVYRMLYDQDFDYEDFDSRMQMQKAVYLLQDMGVPMGDYGFRWHKHGPYSQDLHDDMHQEHGRAQRPVELDAEYEEKIRKLHDAIHDPSAEGYTPAQWMECLASMRYLVQNVMDSAADRSDVVSELENRKSHLGQHAVNEHAYALLEGLFA